MHAHATWTVPDLRRRAHWCSTWTLWWHGNQEENSTDSSVYIYIYVSVSLVFSRVSLLFLFPTHSIQWCWRSESVDHNSANSDPRTWIPLPAVIIFPAAATSRYLWPRSFLWPSLLMLLSSLLVSIDLPFCAYRDLTWDFYFPHYLQESFYRNGLSDFFVRRANRRQVATVIFVPFVLIRRAAATQESTVAAHLCSTAAMRYSNFFAFVCYRLRQE